MKQEINEWWAAEGDKTFRILYQLNSNSVVFDLGGYEGDYSNKLYSKYKSNIYIFEAFPKFSSLIKNKFQNNKKIRVFDYGVGGKTEELELAISNDASYLISSRGIQNTDNLNTEKVQIKSFKDAYDETGVDNIDLLKINVEGAEYDIMQNIFDNNLTTKINNFQIQFHNINQNSEKLLLDIRNELSKTHSQDWCFNWVWENWSLK